MFILNGLIRPEIKGSEDREFVEQEISHKALTVGRQFYYRVLTFENQFCSDYNIYWYTYDDCKE